MSLPCLEFLAFCVALGALHAVEFVTYRLLGCTSFRVAPFGLHTPEYVSTCGSDTSEVFSAQRAIVDADQFSYRVTLSMRGGFVHRYRSFCPRILAYISVGCSDSTYFRSLPVLCEVPRFHDLARMYRFGVHDPVSGPPFVP